MPGGAGTGLQALDASVLIWVESEAERVRELFDGRHRGMLIAAHGPVQGGMDGSFIISYPMDEGDQGPHVPAVAGLLEALGWSVVASRHGRTLDGSVNLALLVSTAPADQERRLWLTESVGVTPDPNEPGYAPGLLATPAEGDVSSAGMHDRLEEWVNKGGAGANVAS
jgi:hypothetical protein